MMTVTFRLIVNETSSVSFELAKYDLIPIIRLAVCAFLVWYVLTVTFAAQNIFLSSLFVFRYFSIYFVISLQFISSVVNSILSLYFFTYKQFRIQQILRAPHFFAFFSFFFFSKRYIFITTSSVGLSAARQVIVYLFPR